MENKYVKIESTDSSESNLNTAKLVEMSDTIEEVDVNSDIDSDPETGDIFPSSVPRTPEASPSTSSVDSDDNDAPFWGSAWKAWKDRSQSNKDEEKEDKDDKDEDEGEDEGEDKFDLDTVIVGFMNMGNTCYLNSLFQVILNTDYMIYFFLTGRYKAHLRMNIVDRLCVTAEKEIEKLGLTEEIAIDPDDIVSEKKNTLTYKMGKMFKKIYSEGEPVMGVLSKLLPEIKSRIPMTDTYRHQDAAEFYTNLLEVMENEIKIESKMTDVPLIKKDAKIFKEKFKKIVKKHESLKSEEEKLELLKEFIGIKNKNQKNCAIMKYVDFWDKYIGKTQGKRSFLSDIFNFSTIRKVTCDGCNNSTITIDTDNMMKISVPSSEKSVDLVKILDETPHKIERLTGECQYKCDICREKQDATIDFEYWDYSEVLAIQLKLFSKEYNETFTEEKIIKNKIQVKFPLTLDMNKYKSEHNPENSYKYELYGVIRHIGTPNSGHYVAYAKSPYNGQWFYYNDDDVFPVTEKHIQSKDPYVLFYQIVN